MSRLVRAARREAATIRVRLGLALAVALLPILALSVGQTILSFRRQALDDRASLVAAAERSAASVRARIGAAEVLLQTLAPGSTGLECAQRLAQIKDEIPGYANLIRFSETGRVACAAATVPADPERGARPWFQALASGATMEVTPEPGAVYASEPALLAGVRDQDARGRFDGVLAAVITLASLRPIKADRSLPDQAEVALADADGHYLSRTSPAAFPARLSGRLTGAAGRGPDLWREKARDGALRVYASAPLVGRQVYVLLSAPAHGLVFWAFVNPISAVALPILAFLLALAAVWIVAERGVVRWIAYLQRIAAIYGRGRFTVHPLKAESAPPEIRDLAHALDAMAGTIAARDAALRESLVQKDELMREIHHRVKNNLQVISSLVNLQQRALSDPAARAAMTDTRQRITALALVYRALYQGPDLKRVDLHDFLDELISQLVMSDSVKGGSIRTELAIEPLIIDPDRLAPLALFAVEAITNARKHGLGELGGTLKVDFTVRGAQAELAISDTGVPGAPAQVGEGVGRTLMTAFARQLRGEVSFCANNGGGLTARLTFPTPDSEGAAAQP